MWHRMSDDLPGTLLASKRDAWLCCAATPQNPDTPEALSRWMLYSRPFYGLISRLLTGCIR